MRRAFLHLFVFSLALFFGLSASAEERSGPLSLVPNASIGDTLRDLSSRSGIIFVGSITSISHSDSFVEVVFQVEQPLCGQLGSTYTLREWSGLWAAGQQRYHLGQRAMYFLHTPGPTGLSSPVDGMEGIVPVIPMGADTEPLLDTRWLATRLKRTQTTPLASLDASAMTLSDAIAIATRLTQSEPIEPILRPLPVGVRPVFVMPIDSSANAPVLSPELSSVLAGAQHVVR